ncbi:MAG TPA: HEAT repeat domain-containing protein [Gemmatimonadaceae bacterium]|nr:HEAT repeat domain-containing protein [Gemmatimonadaceae bacterium]
MSIRSFLMLATFASTVSAQPAMRHTGRTLPPAADARTAFAHHTVDEWLAQSLDDTSVFRRDRTNAALRRAPASFRATMVVRFAAELRDGASQERRARALQALAQLTTPSQGELGLFDGIRDVKPVIPELVRIVRTSADPLRVQTVWLLCDVASQSRDLVAPAAREAIRDQDASMRSAGAALLGIVGDATDEAALTSLLNDGEADVRARASYSLGLLPRRNAVGPLERMLRDSSPYVRAMALKALANIGPAARPALPAVTAMIGDTTHWRQGNYAETIGAEAAWAASRIVPRRGISAIPARVDVDDRGNALRSDGLGSYVAGADSIDAFVSAALNLDLSGPRGDGRAARLPTVRALRRSLVFDLTHPVPASGARPLGVVRDNEAALHVFWSHVHDKRMISITNLDPIDTAVTSERAELQFRIAGEPYVLQFGEWTEDEFNPLAPKINGRGSTPCRIWHPAADEWTVIAPPGSAARLWKMSNAQKPVDLGLYLFPFAVSWSGFAPAETMGTLAPTPH